MATCRVLSSELLHLAGGPEIPSMQQDCPALGLCTAHMGDHAHALALVSSRGVLGAGCVWQVVLPQGAVWVPATGNCDSCSAASPCWPMPGMLCRQVLQGLCRLHIAVPTRWRLAACPGHCTLAGIPAQAWLPVCSKHKQIPSKFLFSSVVLLKKAGCLLAESESLISQDAAGAKADVAGVFGATAEDCDQLRIVSLQEVDFDELEKQFKTLDKENGQ